ncbi:MAG TPA: hypothetical protein VFZ60_06870 [Nitrososphaeraceae archaeon]|jgi:hypothetical protein
MSENVKSIFKRALAHYVRVLRKLQEDKDLEFSNDIFNVSIQGKIDKIEDIIKGLDSPLFQDTSDQNKELLCHALQSYIEGLENMKELINSRLQSSEPSIPEIKFANAENEIELAKRIQVSSCFEKGYK